MGRYPVALHPALDRLARYDPHPERTADRLLGKDFPNPEHIRAELDTLRGLAAPTDAQRRRIGNLHERLTAIPPASAQRLTRLDAKVATAADRKALDGWLSAVDRGFRQALQEHLGLVQPPDWLGDEAVISAFVPHPRLSSSFRTLAKRLLQVRAADPPWDLRDAPPNRAFLQKMTERGLALDAWLAPQPEEVRTPDGRTLVLALAHDPIEIFHMGGHFGTCLAPGAFNYFSVFANAADINKRVLFARDGQRVHGRMLIALTDDGGVLPFHPYAHSQRDGFRQFASRFVQRLADDMGTLVVSSGRVSSLVAPAWYDDGPVDFTQQLEPFTYNSAFRRELIAMPPARLEERLREVLAPLPLNELTLPMVLALPELEARPELFVPLLPIARRSSLPLHTVIQLVKQLLEADIGLDAPTAGEWLHATALREVHPGCGWPLEAAQLLAEIAPLRALDLLKRSRLTVVRDWREELDAGRLMAGARAYEQLRRTNKARALYERALTMHLDRTSERTCRAALDRLDGGTP